MVMKKKFLGELLIEAGAITTEQRDKALQEQKRLGKRLGEALISLGFITEEKMAQVLGSQLEIPFVRLKDINVAPEAVKLVNENLARKLKVFPMTSYNETLTIAMADPLDVFAIDEIKRVTKFAVNPVVITETELMNAYDRYYRGTGAMEEVIKDIGVESVYVPDEERRASIEGVGDETPVVKLVNLLITQAVRDRASDIHIEAEANILRVRYRVDGILHEVMTPPRHLHLGIVSRVKILSGMDIAEKRIPQDGRFPVNVEGKQLDVRTSTLPTLYGEKVVMRLLEKTAGLPPLTGLGFSEDTLNVFIKLIKKPYGFILATGPTGSGKTTTIYSALKHISSTEKNIITIEDPIEYNLKFINQVQINPKAGLTFGNGLRSILRQDPDIIMVGEIRDLDTASIATHAALTGHLVLSTLHTNEAVGAIARLIDMGVEPFLITSSLIGVVAQRLIRKVCPHCKETYKGSSDLLKEVGVKGDVELVKSKGCNECRSTGYLGREGLLEILLITESIKKLIIQKATASELKAQAVRDRFRTMREEGIIKAMKKVTTIEEVIRVTQETE
ncbi:MAG: Flp pilus assembly complex ATPase component TadA [Nitrospirae bacterium]|nr:Flp pilus assembly complex ATPase component TadA [Nitrospirota bacterium]